MLWVAAELVPGWHSCAMMMRLTCDAHLVDLTRQGSPGIAELRWLSPVRTGDSETSRC